MRKVFTVTYGGEQADERMNNGIIDAEEMQGRWDEGVDGIADMVEENVQEKFGVSMGDDAYDIISDIFTGEGLAAEFVYNLMYDKGMLNDSAIAAAMDMAYFEEFSPDELPIIISKGDEVIFEIDESVLADIK